jgi:hypothetical protein
VLGLLTDEPSGSSPKRQLMGMDHFANPTCWGPSAYEGPQKQDLTIFLEHNV